MSDTTPTLLASREAREVIARQMAYQHITDHPDAWVDMSEQRRDGWRARAQSVIDALFASGVVQEPAAAITAARAEGDADRARVEALTYASDDGTEHEHNDGCQGEAECPACWAQAIRAALTSGDQAQARADQARADIDATLAESQKVREDYLAAHPEVKR